MSQPPVMHCTVVAYRCGRLNRKICRMRRRPPHPRTRSRSGFHAASYRVAATATTKQASNSSTSRAGNKRRVGMTRSDSKAASHETTSGLAFVPQNRAAPPFPTASGMASNWYFGSTHCQLDRKSLAPASCYDVTKKQAVVRKFYARRFPFLNRPGRGEAACLQVSALAPP
jgi:hypothetical protein